MAIPDEIVKVAHEAYCRKAMECVPSINRMRWALEAANGATAGGFLVEDCDHPQINKATERWNICPDCGQTWPRGLPG